MRKRNKRISLLLATAILVTSISVVSTGCGSKDQQNGGTEEIDMSSETNYDTPEDTAPATYTSEEELPDDTFFIVHEAEEKGKDKKEHKVTYYYQVYNAEHNFDGPVTSPAGDDPTRIEWVNYNVDEGQIPTFYPGDKLIYKSSKTVPEIYYWEKFFDEGYTFGIAGLKEDLSGNYKYDTDNGAITMSTSDATGFDAQDADSIYLVSAGKEKISSKNVNEAGIVTGLKLMHAYKCDIRTGTERIDATLTANIHCFTSAENYLSSKYTFQSEHISEIEIPEYLTTGYYNINGLGLFRFLKTQDSYEDLTSDDYNDTIYQYDDLYGSPMGTSDGYVLDENGILVKSNASTLLDGETGDPDYDNNAYDTDQSTITKENSDPTDENGYMNGTYTITKVSDPVIYSDGKYYTITAEQQDTDKMLTARLYIETSSSVNVPEVDKTYTIAYAKSTRSNYKDYEIFSINVIE